MSAIKIIAMPRDSNPYQELLYGPLRASGIQVRYAGVLTPSHTVNLLLLPLELLWNRLGGYRVLHLHWLFGFRFTGPSSWTPLLRASRLWFAFVLWFAHLLGLRIVWTAHNVLPHSRIFDDDLAARRLLVRASDLVIAPSQYALGALDELVATPRKSVIIALGPYDSEQLRRLPPPDADGPRTVLLFGRIEPYKGAEDLLDAAAQVHGAVSVVISGYCADRALRDRLSARAAALDGRAAVSFEYVSDDALAELLGSADALVFPFREVTTSSSIMLGLAAGRPLIVPDLPALAELQEEAVIRYPAGIEGLAGALTRLAAIPAAELRAKGAAARSASEGESWEEVAAKTATALEELLA